MSVEPSATDVLRPNFKLKKPRKGTLLSRQESGHVAKHTQKPTSDREVAETQSVTKAKSQPQAEPPVEEEEAIIIPEVGTVVPDSFWMNPLCKKAIAFKVSRVIQVGEAIGQGSFGTVFKISIGREAAALKCVQKSATSQEQQRELTKVKCEFSVWRAVSEHPHVVSLIGFLQTDRNWCFVMEYASLGSLSHYLKDTGGPLEVEQSRRLAGQLAHAIHCVHEMGFLHRDISCSNILLVRSATQPKVLDAKLTDFGLSIRGQTSSSRCGSLAYMSPEVLERSPYATDADWWSYGIVVYCMFVGRTPLSVYAKKKHIELSSLSREMRYELAKNVTIHITRQLSSEQRAFLIDILRDNPVERLGVWRFSLADGRASDTLEPFRRHKFLAGFDWSALDAIEVKLKQQRRHGRTGPFDSKEELELPSPEERLLSAPCSPQLKFPHDRSLSD
ncbi:tyrosine-protein kinase SYK-like [Tropilaelaps mercedesae]|uniref:Tyrosine-protein kinase SYK-like n=1 Tax=Tropilaelaps mercedesae TaxID=418985 RepID=A0A1V9XCK4_9ACAR|nr:tyrosine-protein kinase SYK-like [Tropilaelaps mercedesae]